MELNKESYYLEAGKISQQFGFIIESIARISYYNNQILDRLEELVRDYFNSDDLINRGLPSVQYIAEQLNLSPKYLSSLLKSLTGQNTQQYLHEKLIEKAKEKLTTTNLSINEIAYELGFEHLQSFSKLFKAKTKASPMEFRQSFN